MLIALLVSMMLDGSTPAAAPAPVPAPPQTPVRPLVLPTPTPGQLEALRFVWREHPSLRGGPKFRIDFTAKMQYDGRDPGDAPVLFDTWQLHRLRFGVEGTVFRHIQYQVEHEDKTSLAANPLKSPWRDVYVDTDYIDAAQIRVGKFKIPFGLDAQGGDSNLDFVYRSLGGTYLAPGRDIGAMVHGRFFKRALNYWVGGFRHDGENSRSTPTIGVTQTIVGEGDRAGAGRLSVRPFAKMKGPLAQAEIGGDFMFSDVSDALVVPNGLRGQTVVSEYTFFERVFVKGQRRRMGVDLDWPVGPFGLQAEFLRVTEQRERQGLGDQNLPDARARSWYSVASYVLTGEKKAGGVVPKKGLFMGGIGAVEVAGRYDELRFDSKAGQDPPFRNSRAETILLSGDRVWTLGVNWYVNKWVKLQLNGIREQAVDPERGPIAGGAAYWSKVFRLQFEI